MKNHEYEYDLRLGALCLGTRVVADYVEQDGLYTAYPVWPGLADVPQATGDSPYTAFGAFARNCRKAE